MKEDNTEVMVELWEKIQEFIAVNKRDDAAYIFLSTILNSETLDVDKFELIETDGHLENAYTTYKNIEGTDEEDEELISYEDEEEF